MAHEEEGGAVKHSVVSFPTTKYFCQTTYYLNFQVILFPKRRDVQKFGITVFS